MAHIPVPCHLLPGHLLFLVNQHCLPPSVSQSHRAPASQATHLTYPMPVHTDTHPHSFKALRNTTSSVTPPDSQARSPLSSCQLPAHPLCPLLPHSSYHFRPCIGARGLSSPNRPHLRSSFYPTCTQGAPHASLWSYLHLCKL